MWGRVECGSICAEVLLAGTKNLRHLSDHKPEGRKVVGSAIWESRRLEDLRLKLGKKEFRQARVGSWIWMVKSVILLRDLSCAE